MTKEVKKKGNFRRTLYYFWKALMTQKWRTLTLWILIPVWVFISYVIVPRGTSDIIGMLSGGDFELEHYTGVLIFTLVPSVINNLGIVRILDWLDWSLDAKCGEYLSQLAFATVINQSMTFHSNKFSGSLTSAANKLPGAFIDLKSNFTWDIFPLLLTVVYTIVATAMVCAPIAIILLIYVVAYATVAIVTYYKTTRYDTELAEAENKQTGQLADSITNEVSVKSYAREGFEKTRFARATHRVHDATMNVAKVSFWRNLAMNSINMITFALFLVLIILSHDWFGLTIANMVFIYSMANTLLSNIWTLNHILRAVNRSFGNAKEMAEILDLPYIVDDKNG